MSQHGLDLGTMDIHAHEELHMVGPIKLPFPDLSAAHFQGAFYFFPSYPSIDVAGLRLYTLDQQT